MDKVKKSCKGFTLIELLVVVLIVGILAAIAIPQYFKTVEKSKLGEANAVFNTIKSAQERYRANGGLYASDLNNLDISYANLSTALITLRYFTAGLSATAGTSYMLTLTRTTANSSVSGRYGAYSVVINVPDAPTIALSANPGGSSAELLN